MPQSASHSPDPVHIAPGSDFAAAQLDPRIALHESAQMIEIDLRGLYFHSSADANAFYDRIEERISETGEPLWFFLVNATDYRVDDTAWFAFTRRGRDLQEAHSMGTVHFDDSAITRAQIARNAGTEAFDPNLFSDRDAAMSRLRSLPSRRMQRVEHIPTHRREDIVRRIGFDAPAGIMNVDFTGISFEHSRDVNDIYNWIEELIRPTNRKWYFLINYDGTRIQSPAWVQFAARGKALNERFSLGSVRYAPGSETETDIRQRAESQGFRPNIRNTRAEAIARIDEMKAEAALAPV